MLRLIVPNSDYSALNIGYFGEELPYSPYAFWLPGSYWNGSLTPRDQSGNSRHLAKLGAPVVSPYWAQCMGGPNCFEAPFTLNTASSAGAPRALTMLHVTKVASNLLYPAMGDAFTLPNIAHLFHGSSSELQVTMNSGTSHLDQFTTDTERGNRWTMYAGVFTLTSVECLRRYSSLSTTQTNGATTWTPADTAIGSTTKALRVGGDYLNTSLGPGLVAAAAVWPAALTVPQLDAVYARLQTILNPFGLNL